MVISQTNPTLNDWSNLSCGNSSKTKFILTKIINYNEPNSVNIPLLNGNEAKYVQQAVETGWVSSEGPFVYKNYESKFAVKAQQET